MKEKAKDKEIKNKDIKKLKRIELLELIYYMKEEINALIIEDAKLNRRITEIIRKQTGCKDVDTEFSACTIWGINNIKDKEFRKMKDSQLRELIDCMRQQIEELRNENRILNEELDRRIKNDKEKYISEPEAELAVITNG